MKELISRVWLKEMKREALALFRGAKAISTPEDLLIYDFAVIFQVELISTLNLG